MRLEPVENMNLQEIYSQQLVRAGVQPDLASVTAQFLVNDAMGDRTSIEQSLIYLAWQQVNHKGAIANDE